MTEVRLRNVAPDVLDLMRHQARENRRSMEDEIKAAIAQAANARKHQFLARLDREREEQFRRHGELSDSTTGIRAEREQRW